jgi:hypothetical protein
MPREEAALPGGVRMPDLMRMSVTVLACVYPPAAVKQALEGNRTAEPS